MQPQRYTLEECLKELQREQGSRQFVYKKLVEQKKLTQELANKRRGILQQMINEIAEKLSEGPLFRSAPAAPAPTVTAERLMKRFSDLAGRTVYPDESIFKICSEIEARAAAQKGGEP